MEIYEKTVEVLAPEVNKLLNFMYFQVSINSISNRNVQFSLFLVLHISVLTFELYILEKSDRTILRGS